MALRAESQDYDPQPSSMLRHESSRPILDRLRLGLRNRLAQLFAGSDPRPIRIQRLASPQVRLLEPRFVLNATAELNVMGQLLVMGSEAAETVQLNVDSAGDLQLRDGSGDVIPIDNHPDGPGGSGNPLDPSAVTSGQVIFEMGAGDDVLDLQLPSGLDVTVTPSDGDDRANLQFSRDDSSTQDSVLVDSETITLEPTSTLVSISSDSVHLTGDVFFGSEDARSRLEALGGNLEIDGRLILSGHVALTGSASVDLSEGLITASTPETSLRVALLQPADGAFFLGGADASGGDSIEDLVVAQASNLLVGTSPLSIAGALGVRGVGGMTQFDSLVDADSVSVVTTGDIAVDQAIRSHRGEILLSSSGSLRVQADLDTAFENDFAAVNLLGQSVELIDTQIRTSGGLVNVSGPVEISGNVLVDSGNMQMADSAGRVEFFGPVQANESLGGTLRVDALAAMFDGSVRFEAPIGASSVSPGAVDLNGLEVRAGQIEVDSIGVVDGDVRLTAENIRLFGNEVRASSSGDILVDGGLLLPVGDTSISAADRVALMQKVKGQTGTRDLQITAGTDVRLEGIIESVRNLDVNASQLASVADSVSIGGNLRVDADTIRIAADIDTTFGSPNGDLFFDGATLISIENDAVLFVGGATVQVNAGGGVIDAGRSTLRSDAVGDAITLRGASGLLLGNVVADGGNVTLGIAQDLRGPTDQAPDTALTIDRLTASTGGSIDLTNSANEIRSIERITSGGTIAIDDAFGDLSVANVDSSTNDVLLTTAGSMFVAERAITAIGATITLQANSGIFDSDDTSVANVQTDRLQLNAGAEGIGDVGNPLDVVASTSVNANTSQGSGDIALANVDGALRVGLVDAQRGQVDLTAQSVNDATDDVIVDIVARSLIISAVSGIGNNQALELMSVSDLRAVTESGGIELDLTATTNTVVHQLSAGTGDILVRHRGFDRDLPIELTMVSTDDGAITIDAGGTITALSVVSNNLSHEDDPDALGGSRSRDVTLIARGLQSDILVTTITARGDADVALVAGDDILDSDLQDGNLTTADDLRLTSSNFSDDQVAAIELSTHVNDFQATVVGVHRGDIVLNELDSINLANSDQQLDEIVETDNGQIVITAGENITIFDNSLDDDGDDLKADPEIVARGEQGRIDLQAVKMIELHRDVQLNSEKITQPYEHPVTREIPALPIPEDADLSRLDRSVFLKSDSIVFGERIEINTSIDLDDDGQLDIKQGVARVFFPRPPERTPPDIDALGNSVGQVSDDRDSAFFVPSSIETSILEQAVINDATGVLTLDIGQPGEIGLTVNIDWGAPNREGVPTPQFQQTSGLAADQSVFVGVVGEGVLVQPVVFDSEPPRLSVEHFYTEQNVLFSRENSRDSATAPFEVRFAVRHHESIRIEASSVLQGAEGEPAEVPGGVVSSTDDPTTPRSDPSGLENGQAIFIIPNLTIPVAFIPVRDVIPEIETQQFAPRSAPKVTLIQTAFETFQATTSTVVSREEFFQIRVLSPDPDGEDLASQRLPDDILDGDKIQELFNELPDGRYQVEYVLGDGYARPILRVDVRGGEAIVSGDHLDEGVLRLQPIDSEEHDGEAPDQPIQDLPRPLSDAAPATEDPETDMNTSSLPPIAVGVLTSALERRRRRIHCRRLSVAARYAERSRAGTCQDA